MACCLAEANQRPEQDDEVTFNASGKTTSIKETRVVSMPILKNLEIACTECMGNCCYRFSLSLASSSCSSAFA